jgi:hypothetical protein
MTVQPCAWGFASHQFALLGAIEALIDSDEEKNRLARPIRCWDQPADCLSAYMAILASERARASHPALAGWARESRLNLLGRLGQYRDDSKVVQTSALIKATDAAAVANASKLIAEHLAAAR